MFINKKLAVFLLAASMGISFCGAAEKAKEAKSVEDNNVVESSSAKTSWLGFGLFSPCQYPDEDTEIKVFRFSTIYTWNKAVSGFDCGLLCDAGSGGVDGAQIAISNRTSGTMNGFSLGFLNIAEESMNGFQWGAFYNQAGSDSLDNAGANYTKSSGFQLAFINTADSIFSGCQMGIINLSNTIFKGLQIGLFNMAEQPSDIFADFQSEEFKEEKKKRSCVQIGVLNFNSNGVLPITMLINF
jgi:hypothetical protein